MKIVTPHGVPHLTTDGLYIQPEFGIRPKPEGIDAAKQWPRGEPVSSTRTRPHQKPNINPEGRFDHNGWTRLPHGSSQNP